MKVGDKVVVCKDNMWIEVGEKGEIIEDWGYDTYLIKFKEKSFALSNEIKLDDTVNDSKPVEDAFEIDWTEVDDKYLYAATDKNGEVYFYVKKPYFNEADAYPDGWNNVGASIFLNYGLVDNNCKDWKLSLVERPETTINISGASNEKTDEFFNSLRKHIESEQGILLPSELDSGHIMDEPKTVDEHRYVNAFGADFEIKITDKIDELHSYLLSNREAIKELAENQRQLKKDIKELSSFRSKIKNLL